MCLCACHSDEKFKNLTIAISHANHGAFKTNFKSIIVIPYEGCSGCISNTTAFVKEHIDTLRSNIIFTGIEDFKILKLKIGPKVLKSDKVYFDLDNKLMQKEFASIYPQIVTVDEARKIIQFKVLDLSIFESH